MKKIIYILIITLVALTSCVSMEQRTMEKMLAQGVEVRGVTGFEEYKTVRLCDEVTYLLKLHKYNLNWDECFYEGFVEGINDPTTPEQFYEYNVTKAEYYKNEIVKEKETIAYLETIGDAYPDLYDKTYYTTYRLVYLYTTPEGEKKCNACYGKFNNNGKMMAFKSSGTGEWEILEKTTTVPNLYKY